MIFLNKMFENDFDNEYIGYSNEVEKETDYNEIEITKDNEKVFADGIEEYYKFADDVQ